MRVSTASGVCVGWLWVAAACAPAPGLEDASIEVRVAPLANDGCLGARPLALPAEVDAVVVERASAAGFEVVDRITPGGGPLLLTGVAAGEAALRFVACAGSVPRFVASPEAPRVDENGKSALTLHFKPIDRLGCTGTTQGPSYNRYAGLGRPRAFAATAPLDDGRVLVVGGADTVAGDRLSVADPDAGWDVYSPGESLFLPGVDRARPLSPRAMKAPRVAAAAVRWRAPGASRDGVLVIGGAPAVARGAFPFGPLRPADGLSAPDAEYFDPDDGSFAPLRFEGARLTPRFLAGVAVDGQRVVIVGGITAANEPSDVVEIIDGDRLRVLYVPTDAERERQASQGEIDARLARNVLLGPSVTAIGGGRFFVWAGDYNGCGAQPGWLLSLDPEPRIEPLTLDAPVAAPQCGEPVGCRPWYPTAYHAATALPAVDGEARVLVTGGVVVSSRGLVNNPDPGEACGPNAFVATVDAEAKRVAITPVPVEGEAAAALKRAFHAAAPTSDGRVLIAGGWAHGGNATAFHAADEVLVYGEGGFSLRDDRLSSPRIGGLAAALPGGAVLLGGGIARDGDGFAIGAGAEVYTPPSVDPTVCQ
ncbi:MAG: hypothetical protein H6703_14950 [Myxococcales bacterium]|nr:hypothetical protein [Myxococcales bacterium]